MGDASIKITVDTYGHLVPGANRQAVNRLPGLEPESREVILGEEGQKNWFKSAPWPHPGPERARRCSCRTSGKQLGWFDLGWCARGDSNTWPSDS
jgi:hypothetical protein